MALGGMIGGGIYAVLGVVAGVAGPATWAGFIVAGVIALCTGYSYLKLNRIGDTRGGSVSFVQEFVGNPTMAGMIGWSLLFGYIGSMAMYAFAFAAFAIGFESVPDSVRGFPLRPIISLTVIGLFVLLNVLGAKVTGSAETLMVAVKVGILLAFGVWGLIYIGPVSGQPVGFGLDRLTGITPIVAAAISFVAFQGWQLLFYDQDRIEDPQRTIRSAVYISIPVAVVIYILVAIVTTNLASEAIQTRPHVALAEAASAMLGIVGQSQLGFAIISVSALFSTGSAINATLFSGGYFARGLVQADLLPDDISRSSEEGQPTEVVVVLGAFTAMFAALGSLGAITAFASLAFIVVFGAMSVLALRERDHDAIHPLPPAVGALGAGGFAPIMIWNLYTREPETFWMVLLITVGVVSVELLYFERDRLSSHLENVEDVV